MGRCVVCFLFGDLSFHVYIASRQYYLGRLSCLCCFPVLGCFLSVCECLLSHFDVPFWRGDGSPHPRRQLFSWCLGLISLPCLWLFRDSWSAVHYCLISIHISEITPVLTVGSFYPCLYYGFFCEPKFQILYLTIITLFGFGMCIISWSRSLLWRWLVLSFSQGLRTSF